MARRNSITIVGLQDALGALKEAEDAFGATPLKACLMPIGRRMRDRAKALVPRKTGKLRDLIFVAPGKRNEASVVVGADRKKAPHAHLVEFGHGGPHPAPAHPYLRPAFQELKAAAKQLLGTEITEKIIKKLTSTRRRRW